MNAKEVTIIIPLEQAESIRDGLADVLCWHRGFKAASKDMDDDTDPMGVWALRDIRIALGDAISRVIDSGEGKEE